MSDDGIEVTCHLWLSGDEPEPPRRPAKWDGRPFPGRCDHEADGVRCDNQARGSLSYWDGGAPGVGTFRQTGRCELHPYAMDASHHPAPVDSSTGVLGPKAGGF